MRRAEELDETFSAKVELVMKVLSVSRAGLAKAVGVDKSVAGRWVSGKVMPSAHSLAKLSQFIAQKVPGFTMLDWERPLPEFSKRLSGSPLNPTQHEIETLFPLLPKGLAQEATYASAERTKAYEGIWRTIRPSSDVPGHFLSDISLTRRDENGHLRFKSGVEGFYYEGSAIIVQNQIFYYAADDTFGAISFGIFNGVPRQRADLVDGIIITTLRDAGASPAASSCILERLDTLSDDADADEAKFHDLVSKQKLLVQADDLSEEIVAHLHGAANAPGMLRMLFNQSMSRGPTITLDD